MKNRMKNVLILLFGTLLLWAPSYAQDPALNSLAKNKTEKYNSDQAALEDAASLSPAAKALHERLSRNLSEIEVSKALDYVVASGDKSVVPYLRARLKADYGSKSEIEVALVRLGESEYFTKTLDELSSEDVSVQNLAVRKLSMFKTKEAYRKLYQLLDDEKVRDRGGHGDYIVPSLAYMVKDRLALTVENPPVGADKYSTAAWKAWFQINRHLID